MRNPIGITLVLALALVATLAPRAGAEVRGRRPGARPAKQVETFVLSGTCSGTIDREIRVDGATYFVSPDARIFEIGRGEVPAGSAYWDRMVTLTGVKVRGTLVVQRVTVRPAAWGAGTATVADENRPR